MNHIREKISRETVLTAVFIMVCVGVLFIGFSSGTSIDKYVPKNPDESEIVSLLHTFNKAKNDHDIETYLACLHDEGKFMFSGGGLMASKRELAELLPKFWSDIESSNLSGRPMCRESLNGNFYKGSFYDPVITVERKNAKATVTFKTSVIKWRTLLFLDFKKLNGSWKINRFEWDWG